MREREREIKILIGCLLYCSGPGHVPTSGIKPVTFQCMRQFSTPKPQQPRPELKIFLKKTQKFVDKINFWVLGRKIFP